MGGKLIVLNSKVLDLSSADISNVNVTNVLRIQGLDVSQNIHLLDASANSYQDRLDGIDLSVNRLDTSANNYQDRLDGIDLSVNRLDTSANNYQDRLDGIDLSVNRLDTSANSYEGRIDKIDVSLNAFTNTLILNDINANDISASKIQVMDNLIIPTSQPSENIDGSIYYDTSGSDVILKIHNGTEWKTITGGGSSGGGSSNVDGIWSEISNKIRLTDADNYGKIVDISGLDISNNLSVLRCIAYRRIRCES